MLTVESSVLTGDNGRMRKVESTRASGHAGGQSLRPGSVPTVPHRAVVGSMPRTRQRRDAGRSRRRHHQLTKCETHVVLLSLSHESCQRVKAHTATGERGPGRTYMACEAVRGRAGVVETGRAQEWRRSVAVARIRTGDVERHLWRFRRQLGSNQGSGSRLGSGPVHGSTHRNLPGPVGPPVDLWTAAVTGTFDPALDALGISDEV